jgi:hypothetical protein
MAVRQRNEQRADLLILAAAVDVARAANRRVDAEVAQATLNGLRFVVGAREHSEVAWAQASQSAGLAQLHRAFPLGFEDNILQVALIDPPSTVVVIFTT